MENTPENIEKLTNKWVAEAGIQQPSKGFARQVMDAIDAKSTVKQVYRPLISLKAWGWVAALIIGTWVLLQYMPEGQQSFVSGLETSDLPTVEHLFQNFKLSKTMVYAIGFMALFLVQIPFLKRRFIN
ncbi:MAG: hypothetical protein AAF466_09115 [Bacteroidota bacterium]